ncbi:hypothetical protein Moror_16177 [Moniliophthora roreri MCA 2997]|uniref:Cytochrome b561 domain-containing protein n=2 Tax=Moniliophthora roreri TaxID=221103 RepID=V2X6L0_MONRO|nr:hypothetical protein Moror_16177 [Moniliophthora roreri MCA 2997]
MSSVSFPLFPLEIQARNHAILCTTGFLILLPLGVLVARYMRSFTNRWFPVHAVWQLLVAGPVILTGWYYGWKSAEQMGLGHFIDPHQRMGLALLILYVTQLILGAIIHWIKTPNPFGGTGTRPPQNYFHGFLGLAIFILAASQVHYGLYIEWDLLSGGLHHVPDSAKNAWLALVIVFWALYFLGLGLLPRQFRKEAERRDETEHIALRSGSSSKVEDNRV